MAMRLINSLKRVYRRVTAAYAVVVTSPDLDNPVIHYAWDMTEALEWAACYDNYDYVEIRPSFIGMIAVTPIRVRGC